MVSGKPDRVAVVTGTSSGIGEAVARELLQRGWHVIGIARRPVAFPSPDYTHFQVDLGDLPALAGIFDTQLDPLVSAASVSRLALVNNAADVALLGPVELLDPVALLKAHAVNAAAPIFLMGRIVRHAAAAARIRIVNLSTGAAVHPLPGLGAYASTKAALRMGGMVLAAELDARAQSGEPALDASILSYEPGIVDTAMQATIRTSPATTLPIVERFERFAAEGQLVSPTGPALDIANYVDGDGHPTFSETRYPATAGTGRTR
jgi:benzil reductase ((S)-benzoin forming)